MNNQIVNIVSATATGDYRLSLYFDDGTMQEVDFKPFLERSVHPAIRAFLDAKKFAGYRIAHGELVWGDFELCFPMMDLYTNQIDKLHQLAAA